MTPHWVLALRDPQVTFLLFDVFCAGVMFGLWAQYKIEGFFTKRRGGGPMIERMRRRWRQLFPRLGWC